MVVRHDRSVNVTLSIAVIITRPLWISPCYVHTHGQDDPIFVMSNPHVEHSAVEIGNASPGGLASNAGRVPAALSMPGRICVISNKCCQVVGLLNALVMRSAACCLVLTYRIRTRGWAHTS